jgi:hypothetical protein
VLKQDVDLDRALERLFKNGYPFWKTINVLRRSDSPEALLAGWRGSKKPSQAWRMGVFFGEAIGILSVALDLPRQDTEALVAEYVGATETHDISS